MTEAFADYARLKTEELAKNIKRSQGTFYLVASVTIVLSVLMIATTSAGISVFNQCNDFGGNPPSGLQIFFIIMLIISILVFIGAILAIAFYVKYQKDIKIN